MKKTKYVYSELKSLFTGLVKDEIDDSALRTSSYFDYWDMKVKGYAVLVTIKSKAFIQGDENSEKYREIERKEFPVFEKDLGLEDEEMKRFVYLKQRRREKRGIKTLYNIRPVEYSGQAKSQKLIQWNKGK